jgi:hypothetical protein
VLLRRTVSVHPQITGPLVLTGESNPAGFRDLIWEVFFAVLYPYLHNEKNGNEQYYALFAGSFSVNTYNSYNEPSEARIYF